MLDCLPCVYHWWSCSLVPSRSVFFDATTTFLGKPLFSAALFAIFLPLMLWRESMPLHFLDASRILLLLHYTFFFPFMSTVVHIPVHKRKDSLPTTRWREVNKVQQGQAILRHSQNNDPVFLDTTNISWMPIFNLFIYMPIYSLFIVICYLFMVYSFHKALLIYITGIAINQ